LAVKEAAVPLAGESELGQGESIYEDERRECSPG
jgi:hypothetical protein